MTKPKSRAWSGVIVTALIVAILGSCFYWFQWRPSKAVKDCEKIAKESDRAHGGERQQAPGYEHDKIYIQCLREKGLK